MEGGPGGGELQAQGLGVGALDPDRGRSWRPISPTIERDDLPPSSVLYAGGRILMRRRDMWASAFGPGAGSSGEFGSDGARLMEELTNGLPKRTLLAPSFDNRGKEKGRGL